MRVLVTGGLGYVGCVLVDKLFLEGHTVTIFDKLLFATKRLVDDYSKKADIVQGDILDLPKELVEQSDVVCHLAAVSNDPSAELSEDETFRINVDGTAHVAQLCIDAKKPLLYASTASVYGRRDWTLCTEEDSVLNPQSTYGRSKVAAEKVLLQLSDRYPDFNPVIFRQSTVYGWSPRMRFDLVVNTFVAQIYDRGYISLYGGGEAWRPHVAVQDVALAYLNFIENPARETTIINLVHENIRISELALRLQNALATEYQFEVYTNYLKPKDTRSYAISSAKAQSLGILCPTPVEESAMEMLRYIDNSDIDVHHPIYYNHKWLQLLIEHTALLNGVKIP